MFASQISIDEPIIHDYSREELQNPPPDCGRGLNLSLRGSGDYEYGDVADPFPASLLIPQSEWQARIQEMEASKSRLSDMIRLANLPPKDQASTNYCWINAPTHACEIVRLQQGQPMVILSPASAGAQITNYRNVGGWGKDGLQFIVDHGLVPVDKWPANAINPKYATPENLQLAKQYRVVEWTELKPRNLQQLMSMLLRRIPVAVGYNFWSHEVVAVDPVWIDGGPAIRIRNSWKGWGDYGFGILQGSKALPDDAVAPRTANAA
ncbi:MAG: hypothetical protein EBR82_51815 [Caulobacteraceae bacterium]|nr:hypothetical protein [Caulobacteraceae bacterium]